MVYVPEGVDELIEIVTELPLAVIQLGSAEPLDKVATW